MSRRQTIGTSARIVARLERPLTSDAARIIKGMGASVSVRVATGARWEATLEPWARTLAAVLVKRLKIAATAGARNVGREAKSVEALFETKSRMQPDFVSPYVLGWIRRHAAKQVTRIRATTAKTIRRQIIEGSKRGWSNDRIAKAIREATRGRIGQARALRIARTETHTAFERGSYEQARQVVKIGVDIVSEWGATEDDRTRPAHAEADGQVREIEETFIVGGEAMRFPGDPRASARNIANCRCVALYRPRRAGE